MKKSLINGVAAVAFFGYENIPMEQAVSEEADSPKSGGKLIVR
jgi:hypothetical protein